MSLPDRVLRTVRHYGMVPRGGRLLVALSGGPDSVALTLIARELEARGELAIAGLAHLNHALRPEADADEAFCRALAVRLGVTFRSCTVDVRARANERRTSLEDAGRSARYEFLAASAAELGVDAIATGHTLDDQAETYLLRLVRGAGPRGLAGIYPVAGQVVRPLIETRRAELKAYLVEREQESCEDATNRDLSFPRNRIRHELIPALERDYSPNIVEVLAREAAIARADEEYLRAKAIDSAETIVLTSSCGRAAPPAAGSPTCEVDVEALEALHPAIAARVVQLALASVSDRFIGFEHVQRFLAFARGGSAGSQELPGRLRHGSGGLSLPGVQALRRGDRIALVREQQEPFSNSFEIPLSIPGEVTLDRCGWAISAEAVGADNTVGAPAFPESQGLAVRVQAGRPVLPLSVRSRRRGDRFRPAGLGGRGKKLQDFLVDRKVPREQRDWVPLVVDGDGRIVWIVGHGVAEDFRVTEPSQGVILLKARRLGGPG
jgi:tRNA(Ile)-lysidine synthase